MRVALLASTIALLSASPAFAQCVYVACQGGGQNGPTYQQPVYQAPQQYYAPAPSASLAPSAPTRAAPGYDEGYAAGLAARPTVRRAITTTHRAAPTRARTTTTSSHGTRRTSTSSGVYGMSSGASRTMAARTGTAHTHAAQAPARRAHVTSSASARPRAAAPRRVVATRAAPRSSVRYTSNNGGTYQDPIRDRAATYRPSVYGQSTSMASLMSRSSSYSSSATTTWSGPATVVNQGGQVCGWGARIVTNSHGYAQRQAVWVCQCPQGWRPPGY